MKLESESAILGQHNRTEFEAMATDGSSSLSEPLLPHEGNDDDDGQREHVSVDVGEPDVDTW
jgi:hypothetical protein